MTHFDYKKLSQFALLVVMAFSLAPRAVALAEDPEIAIDAGTQFERELLPPGELDEQYAEEELNAAYSEREKMTFERWNPDRSGKLNRGDRDRGFAHRELTDRSQFTTACYVKNVKNQYFVSYNRDHNARQAQSEAMRFCNETSLHCEYLGCTREWINQ